MTQNSFFHAVPQARDVLAQLRTLFDSGLAALAAECAVDGRLDSAKLDQYQLASYELAWAAAELLAAEVSVNALTEASSPLEVQAAMVFIVEAVPTVLSKLETVYGECGMDDDLLGDLQRQAQWRKLKKASGSAAALEKAGLAIALADGDVPILLEEDHAMAQDSFRKFSAEVVSAQAQDIHRQDLIVPETLLQPMRDMGVFGLAIPQRFGGIAPDDRDDTLLMVVVTEALSEGSLAAAGSLITRPEILTRALLAGGTEEQKAHWLPKLAAGDPLCAIAMTEPDYGSDVAAVSLRGTRTEGGWLLDGAKTWCTFAGKAGVIMVVTRTHPDRKLGHRGLSVMLVEKPSFDTHMFDVVQPEGGRLTGRAIPTIGYRGMHSFDLHFESYFVPDRNVVGEEGGIGKGFYYTMAGMIGGRMQTSARACGVMRAALRSAISHCRDRKVFGKPLLDLPLTQVKIARMGARLAACRRLAYTTAAVVDGGGGKMEASLVKLLACRSAELVTREALQLHGGMGYAEETPVSRYFVDARVLSIFEGAEETLALKVIARSLMERALTVEVAPA